METMRLLPEVDDRRFGTISLGYDRVLEIRREHAALASVAALVCGIATPRLTVQGLEIVMRDIQARMGEYRAMPPEGAHEALCRRIQAFAFGEADPTVLVRDVLAWAAQYQPPRTSPAA